MDLVKKLKDAPQGTILYCTIVGDVMLKYISEGDSYPIHTVSVCNCNSYSFTKEGEYYIEESNGECILFPSKDNRDWDNVNFRKDLPIDTPVAVFDVISNNESVNIYNMKIRYYAGRGRAFNDGYNSCNSHGDTLWKYIIPLDRINFENFWFNKCDNYGSITW